MKYRTYQQLHRFASAHTLRKTTTMSFALTYILLGYITLMASRSLIDASPLPSTLLEERSQSVSDVETSAPDIGSSKLDEPKCSESICVTYTTRCICRCVDELSNRSETTKTVEKPREMRPTTTEI